MMTSSSFVMNFSHCGEKDFFYKYFVTDAWFFLIAKKMTENLILEETSSSFDSPKVYHRFTSVSRKLWIVF